jgi:hypothetical protein
MVFTNYFYAVFKMGVEYFWEFILIILLRGTLVFSIEIIKHPDLMFQLA